MLRNLDAIHHFYGNSKDENLLLRKKEIQAISRNLTISDNNDFPISLANLRGDTVSGNVPALKKVLSYIYANRFDVCIFDPFSAIHQLDNAKIYPIYEVCICLPVIAEACDCAIGVVHHAGKAGRTPLEDWQRETVLYHSCNLARTINKLPGEAAKSSDRKIIARTLRVIMEKASDWNPLNLDYVQERDFP